MFSLTPLEETDGWSVSSFLQILMRKETKPLTEVRLWKRMLVLGLGYSHGNLCRGEKKCMQGEGERRGHGGSMEAYGEVMVGGHKLGHGGKT